MSAFSCLKHQCHCLFIAVFCYVSFSNAVGLNVAFNLLFGMAFLASSFVVFVVQERNNGAKHVQFVSGVDPLSYWTASWMWDLINFTLPCICIIILFALFDVPAYTGITSIVFILDRFISSKLFFLDIICYRSSVTTGGNLN